jgi:hypothetical protein
VRGLLVGVTVGAGVGPVPWGPTHPAMVAARPIMTRRIRIREKFVMTHPSPPLYDKYSANPQNLKQNIRIGDSVKMVNYFFSP